MLVADNWMAVIGTYVSVISYYKWTSGGLFVPMKFSDFSKNVHLY